MYTSGVTKIFINRNEKNNLKDTEMLAVSSGY
ncbi:hypothetical protein NVP1165O_40 [Vibrio phage 1.165.O._10N.261.51.B7]|nr:hypothetical protein NVP1165O_40 [Vibrio phage 1.165.O._10N.261.51.B7]